MYTCSAASWIQGGRDLWLVWGFVGEIPCVIIMLAHVPAAFGMGQNICSFRGFLQLPHSLIVPISLPTNDITQGSFSITERVMAMRQILLPTFHSCHRSKVPGVCLTCRLFSRQNHDSDPHRLHASSRLHSQPLLLELDHKLSTTTSFHRSCFI